MVSETIDFPNAGTYVLLWLGGDMYLHIKEEYEDRIDAAVARWLEHRVDDELLLLEKAAGDRVRVRASEVLSIELSTPEGRKREIELIAALELEEKMYKKKPWEEED